MFLSITYNTAIAKFNLKITLKNCISWKFKTIFNLIRILNLILNKSTFVLLFCYLLEISIGWKWIPENWYWFYYRFYFKKILECNYCNKYVDMNCDTFDLNVKYSVIYFILEEINILFCFPLFSISIMNCVNNMKRFKHLFVVYCRSAQIKFWN